MAPKNLHFESPPILKEQSSANIILEMHGNIDEAPCRTCRDDGSSAVETLDEATQKVKDLLAGRSQEIEIVSSTDKSIRKAVAGELLASLSRPNIEEREQARRLFLNHGYLDDAIKELGSTGLPNERVMAAHALGLIANPRGIVSLVEALLDDAPEVRHAAEQALTQISGPVVDLSALLEKELYFDPAEMVETFSTPTTVDFQETPFQNPIIEERMVEKPMSAATEERASTISLEEEAVQKAMEELKHQLLEAEDLTRKRNESVQKAMQELKHQLLEAEDLTRKRIELETAQLVEAHAARCAEAQQALREVEEQHETEMALLFSKKDEFQQALEVVAQQRAGVEEAHLEIEIQIRRFGEEKEELEAALKARRAAAEELRLESETQLRRFDEEKAELDAMVEARRAAAGEVRLQTQAQIRRFDEEKAELKATVEARRTALGEVRLETEAQIRRFDEETAEQKAAVEARRAGVEEVRLEAQGQIRRFDEEQTGLEASVEARRAGVEEVRLEAQGQMRRFDEEQTGLEATLEARRAGVEEVRLEAQGQMRRFDKEKDELEAAIKARRAAADEERLQTQAQIRRFDEEKAELEAATEAGLAALGEVRLETRARTRRFDEEKAELEAAVEARRAGIEEVRLETESLIRRLDEEKAELAAAAAAREAEADRLRIEAQRQLSEADNISRAEQEQLLLQAANLERLTAEVAHRRGEVEASLHTANEEDKRLLETKRATEQKRLETATQIRQFDEEKAGLQSAVKARQVELEHVRIEAKRQITEAENRIRVGKEQLLSQTAELERVTQEVASRRAEIEASLRKAKEEDERLLKKLQATEQVRLDTEAQARRFDEERAEIEAALKARQAEAERQLIEAGSQLIKAEKGRAKQEQFLPQPADLESGTGEVARRRAEVEAALHKANEEDRQLLEIPQATEQSSQPASEEVLWLEPEICEPRQPVLVTETAAQLADRPDEEVEKLRSVEWEQGELAEEGKSVAVSRVS